MQKRKAIILMILLTVAVLLALGGQVLAAATATTVVFPDGLSGAITQHSKIQLTAVVPDGVTDGNLIVNTDTGTSNPAPFMVGDWFVPDPAGAAATAVVTASGILTEDTVWNEDVLVTGDVVITTGVTLTIEPGVTVLFAANSDDQAGGTWPDKAEIRAYGTLTAVGTPTSPIYFTSNADTPAAQDWGAITIYKDSPNAHIAYCSAEYAQYAIYFRNYKQGDGFTSGTVTHCTIQQSLQGISILNRPGTGSIGGNSYSTITITHNLIQNNETGVYLAASTGSSGSSIDYSIMYNNHLAQNGTGILVLGNHWGTGSVSIQSEIRNNFLHDNSAFNIHLQIKDGEVVANPVIENNFFNNTDVMTNTHLYITENPAAGSGSARTFSPIIRYNTFADAAYGIQMETIHDIAMYPAIDHNVFYDLGEFAVSNATTYTVSVEQNYWGSSEVEWDAGADGMVTGTLTITNHLDSNSAPVLTYLSPGQAQAGAEVKLYGANFGVPVVNVPPAAESDSYAAAYETTLTIAAPGVLENDVDDNGDTLTAVLDTNVAHGTLSLNSDGSFVYTPDNGFSGEDSFTYHASDGQVSSGTATVTITVTEQSEFLIFLPAVTK